MSGQLRDQIKQAPISQIVGAFIPLKRSGSGLVGLCPFHADSKPSMTVNDKLGLWRCWPCNRGGDSITFVMDYKKLDFIEAMKECAGILGLSIDELQKEKKKDPRRELAYRLLNYSTKLYVKVASQRPMYFQKFLDERRLTEESVAQFQIGYAPGNNFLVQQLLNIPGDQGQEAQNMALDIDLVRISEKGQRPYDFYRDRIVFPIHDHGGQVRGFSCRKVMPEQEPKFLNSRESFIFSKAAILFGFFLAKSSIREKEQVIIVEGNMDAVMMHQHGFTNTVGTMGVALSESSLKLLTSMTKNVVLAMDSDNAGMNAMISINNAFMGLGVLPSYLSFAPAKDPDDFLREHGRLDLMERIEKAPRFIDHYLNSMIPTPPPETIDQKLALMKKGFAALAPLKEHLEATERIVSLAKRLGLRSDESSILEEYRLSLRGQDRPRQVIAKPAPQQTEIKDEDSSQDDQLQEVAMHTPLSKVDNTPLLLAEKNLLKTLLTHPECVARPQLHEILAYIGHPEVKDLVLWLRQIYLEIDEQEYVTILGDEVFSGRYGREIKATASEAIEQYKLEPLNEKVVERLLKDLKNRLKLDQLRHKRKEYTALQQQSQTEEEVTFYMTEITKIDRDLQELKSNPV